MFFLNSRRVKRGLRPEPIREPGYSLRERRFWGIAKQTVRFGNSGTGGGKVAGLLRQEPQDCPSVQRPLKGVHHFHKSDRLTVAQVNYFVVTRAVCDRCLDTRDDV